MVISCRALSEISFSSTLLNLFLKIHISELYLKSLKRDLHFQGRFCRLCIIILCLKFQRTAVHFVLGTTR